MEETTTPQDVPREVPQDGISNRAKYRNRTSFKKGNAAWKSQKGKSRAPRTPRVLLDMRYVYDHRSGPFKNEAQVGLSEYLKDDQKAYINQLVGLERAHLAKTEKVTDPLSAGGKDAPSLDEGSERCLELIERWLKGHNSSQQLHDS